MSWTMEQMREFVGAGVIGRLATALPIGEPHVVPLWYQMNGDRILAFSLRSHTKLAISRPTQDSHSPSMMTRRRIVGLPSSAPPSSPGRRTQIPPNSSGRSRYAISASRRVLR
jgi:hypothetical protein